MNVKFDVQYIKTILSYSVELDFYSLSIYTQFFN